MCYRCGGISLASARGIPGTPGSGLPYSGRLSSLNKDPASGPQSGAGQGRGGRRGLREAAKAGL